MRRRRHPTRILAFLLLLAFCQRLGASLWVHHFYHEARTHEAGATWETHCDCFDDAFMSMDAATPIVFDGPIRAERLLVEPALPPIPAQPAFHSSLRGPPVLA